jgi:hypothetical protein
MGDSGEVFAKSLDFRPSVIAVDEGDADPLDRVDIRHWLLAQLDLDFYDDRLAAFAKYL